VHGPRHLLGAGRPPPRASPEPARTLPATAPRGGVDSLRLDAAERRRRADRPPDANGWYSKPLSITSRAPTRGSGVASCTAPIRYAKPDSADAKTTGTCRDEAGNVSSPATMSFKFDATAPTAPAVKIVAGCGTVTLEWPSAAGAASYEILREVPAKRGRASLLWHGTGRRFVDRSVKNGTRYRYVVRARDQAGNTAEKRVEVTPLVPSSLPPQGP
jgi:hypothetical protein